MGSSSVQISLFGAADNFQILVFVLLLKRLQLLVLVIYTLKLTALFVDLLPEYISQ